MKTAHLHCREISLGLIISMAACMAQAQSECMSADVQRVVDGDTLVLNGSTGLSERVRLSEVDAPESTQEFGPEARQCLQAILTVAPAHICRNGTDRYGRTLATMQVAGIDVGSALVQLGCAWAYTAYLPAGSQLPAQQMQASTQFVGLWARGAAQAPWSFRAGQPAPAPVLSTPPHERVFAWLQAAYPAHTAGGAATTFDGFGWARCYSGLCVSYRAGNYFLIAPDGAVALAGSGESLTELAQASGF